MHKIVEIKFGSHLYGTATKDSDIDIKAVYLPSARDIVLQRVRPIISESRFKEPGEKNTAEDVDYESYSPEKFLKLLAEGQTVALDMLFAPDSSMLREPDPLWKDIKALAPKILNKKAASFVNYCRRQANKYGIKGSRVAAARQALEFLTRAEEQHGTSEKLVCVASGIERLTENSEFLSTGEVSHPNGSMSPYFEICGKKALLSASIQSARTMAQSLVDEYGERALTAEKNNGVDWKALYHAVRVGYEAIEFLSTHRITFPRPEAEHLLAVKQGRLRFAEVSQEIETLLENVESAAGKSMLPEMCDDRVIDDFIENLHGKIIAAEFGDD